MACQVVRVITSVGKGRAVLWPLLVPNLHARQRLNVTGRFQASTLRRQSIAMIGSLADGVGTLHPRGKAATAWWVMNVEMDLRILLAAHLSKCS